MFFNSENFLIYGTCTFTTQTTVAVLQQSNRTMYEGRRGQQKRSLYQFKFLKWLFWSAGVSRNLHRIFVYVCKANAKNFVVTPTYFCPIRGVLTYFHCTLWSKRVPRCADKCMHGFWWTSYDFKALLSPKIFQGMFRHPLPGCSTVEARLKEVYFPTFPTKAWYISFLMPRFQDLAIFAWTDWNAWLL